MFGIFRRTKIRTPYGSGARAPLPPIPQGGSWSKEPKLTGKISPPPPVPPRKGLGYQPIITDDLPHVSNPPEKSGVPYPPPVNPQMQAHAEYMRRCGNTMQQAKERMKMNCGHPAAEKDFCPQCSYEAKISQYTNTGADELTRLQSLLSTPNLSQANIDEINAQIGALLANKCGAEKTGEVWLDERK